MQAGGSGPSRTSTRVTRKLSIEYPVVLAPFGGLPFQQQAATVSDLGRLGSLGAITTISTATTPEEAKVLAQAGTDIVVISEFEGGGHRGSFLPSPKESLTRSLSLIPQVVDAAGVPAIAAGGIAAALALGADAVQIGTAFLACADSGANDAYRAVLLSDAAANTMLTTVFTGRMARAFSNRLLDELTNETESPLLFPAQHSLNHTAALPAAMQHRSEWMTCWAGQSAKLNRNGRTERFFRRFISRTDAVLSRLSKSAEARKDV